MQKKKDGFTLVELLIALAIAAIVTTMGFTIAKHSTQRAYEGYFYQGYTTFNKLLEEARYKGYTLGNQEFYDNIASRYLSLKDGSGNNRFITTSGIIYSYDAQNAILYMEVPQAKSSNFPTGRAQVAFRYIPNITPYLVPVSGGNVDLSNRVDLLVCYIHDGEQGTVDKCADGDANGNPHYVDCDGAQDAYHPPVYMSVQQALCTTLEDETFRGIAGCEDAGFAFDSTKANMIIKFVNPHKAHL